MLIAQRQCWPPEDEFAHDRPHKYVMVKMCSSEVAAALSADKLATASLHICSKLASSRAFVIAARRQNF